MTNLISEPHYQEDTSSFFDSLLQNSKITGIFILNDSGIILNINEGVKQWLGYQREEIIGKHFSLLFTEEDKLKQLPFTELQTVLTSGSSSDHNYLLHKEGHYIWVNGESVLTKNTQGTVYIIKQVFDLRKQKAFEKNLLHLNKDLKNFVYTASHDLKAPLHNLEGLIDILNEIIIQKEDPTTVLSHITKSITQFKATLSDLAVHGEAQHLENMADLARVSFQEILDAVKLDLQLQISQTGSTIQADFTKVPDIVFSRKNLRSLLYNLISNSVKYKQPEVYPVIEIDTQTDGLFTVISVKDNGKGISEAHQQDMFKLYHRFQHKEVEGTGVGMAIVRHIVSNADGHIELQSKVGQGTTFRIFLPLVQ